MRVQLAEQAREILGQSDLVIITERVDDVALLIGQMVKMVCRRSWTGISPPLEATQNQLGVDGRDLVGSILTEGDHRKVSVETYLKGMYHTLSRLTAQVIEPLDFS